MTKFAQLSLDKLLAATLVLTESMEMKCWIKIN